MDYIFLTNRIKPPPLTSFFPMQDPTLCSNMFWNRAEFIDYIVYVYVLQQPPLYYLCHVIISVLSISTRVETCLLFTTTLCNLLISKLTLDQMVELHSIEEKCRCYYQSFLRFSNHSISQFASYNPLFREITCRVLTTVDRYTLS